MGKPQSLVVLQRYFAGITEHVFQVQLGIANIDLIDYVVELLMRFVRTDSLRRVRSLSGRPLTEPMEMLGEANQCLGLARREAHKLIGDYLLFWAGLYPEALRTPLNESRRDAFNYFCHHGKIAYRIASSVPGDTSESESQDVLMMLSDSFSTCAYGLREVRREWERRDDDEITHPHLLG